MKQTLDNQRRLSEKFKSFCKDYCKEYISIDRRDDIYKGIKKLEISIHQAEQEMLKKTESREEKYQELIMAVTRAYKGETRHETALRYIQGAEKNYSGEDKSASLSSLKKDLTN